MSCNLGELLKRANEKHLSFNTKTVRDAAFPQLELLLLDFIAFARSAKMAVTQAIIQMGAIRLQDEIIPTELSEEEKWSLQNVSASIG